MKIVIKTIAIITLLISMSYLLESDVGITDNSILDIEQYDEYTIPPIVIYNDIDEKAEVVTEEHEPVISYTEEEYDMLCWMVQQEVRDASIEHKRIIANIVVNRVKDGRFGSNIREVLEGEGQFEGIRNWYSRKYEPDEETREGVWGVYR